MNSFSRRYFQRWWSEPTPWRGGLVLSLAQSGRAQSTNLKNSIATSASPSSAEATTWLIGWLAQFHGLQIKRLGNASLTNPSNRPNPWEMTPLDPKQIARN